MNEGDQKARNELIENLYEELYRLAGSFLSKNGQLSQIDRTELVNTACRRMLRSGLDRCARTEHIVGLACRAMRSALVDTARRNKAQKRLHVAQPLDVEIEAGPESEFQERAVDLHALDEALNELVKADAQAVKLIEMRFFGGLPMGRIAEILGISDRTADRRWNFARRWLLRRLS
ncbi:MAG: sigma-70 family RNA polymerase sigma factor [Planctomycetes bacterium]|nr:sigma-70 family RNA polymerase sigma factor [Planctomycetota bacterium]